MQSILLIALLGLSAPSVSDVNDSSVRRPQPAKTRSNDQQAARDIERFFRARSPQSNHSERRPVRVNPSR